MHHLALASASLSKFQQLAFSSKVGEQPQHTRLPPISTVLNGQYSSPPISLLTSSQSGNGSVADTDHEPTANRRSLHPYFTNGPNSTTILHSPSSYSSHSSHRSHSEESECCGGILDCEQLCAPNDYGQSSSRVSGVRSTSHRH